MSVKKFEAVLPGAKYGQNDKKWFPLWIRRYASAVKEQQGLLPVTVEDVLAFSRSLLNNRTPAWQRLQGVRAVEAYRDLVLGTAEPSLADIRQKLGIIAEQERQNDGVGSGRPDVRRLRRLRTCIVMKPWRYGVKPSQESFDISGRSWQRITEWTGPC